MHHLIFLLDSFLQFVAALVVMSVEKPLSTVSEASASKTRASPATSRAKHVVVIGAGAGGTCLAARLAKMGHRVTVVEKNDFGGGRCSLLTQGGHRWDQGECFAQEGLTDGLVDGADASACT